MISEGIGDGSRRGGRMVFGPRTGLRGEVATVKRRELSTTGSWVNRRLDPAIFVTVAVLLGRYGGGYSMMVVAVLLGGWMAIAIMWDRVAAEAPDGGVVGRVGALAGVVVSHFISSSFAGLHRADFSQCATIVGCHVVWPESRKAATRLLRCAPALWVTQSRPHDEGLPWPQASFRPWADRHHQPMRPELSRHLA